MARAISCNVYISEGRSATRLAALQKAAHAAATSQRPAGACAHVYHFTDEPYHRSSFTFVGTPRAVAGAAHALASAALVDIALDLRQVRVRAPDSPAVCVGAYPRRDESQFSESLP